MSILKTGSLIWGGQIAVILNLPPPFPSIIITNPILCLQKERISLKNNYFEQSPGNVAELIKMNMQEGD